jgi:hypothetical protein
MADPKPPEPDKPTPSGVEPNKPKDPSVYGGRWGAAGGQKPKDPPPDRPAPIKPPDESSGQPDPDSPPATS